MKNLIFINYQIALSIKLGHVKIKYLYHYLILISLRDILLYYFDLIGKYLNINKTMHRKYYKLRRYIQLIF